MVYEEDVKNLELIMLLSIKKIKFKIFHECNLSNSFEVIYLMLISSHIMSHYN